MPRHSSICICRLSFERQTKNQNKPIFTQNQLCHFSIGSEIRWRRISLISVQCIDRSPISAFRRRTVSRFVDLWCLFRSSPNTLIRFIKRTATKRRHNKKGPKIHKTDIVWSAAADDKRVHFGIFKCYAIRGKLHSNMRHTQYVRLIYSINRFIQFEMLPRQSVCGASSAG